MSAEPTFTASMRNAIPSQRGAALIMAMVILLILTIIGVTALNTSSLEAKMAGNTQDINRAFEAAESGLSKAMNTAGAFDLYKKDEMIPFTFDGGKSGSAETITNFLTFSPPKRGSGYSAINYDSANFDMKSTGIGTTGAKTVLHQGASQIVNKAE